MPVWIVLLFSCLFLPAGLPVSASDSVLERLLRLQVFNQAFEGFDYYYVTIEDDRPQADGSREVTAVASGRFLESMTRMKVLLLIVGDRVIGGQGWREPDYRPVSRPNGVVRPNGSSLQEEVAYATESVSRRLCRRVGSGVRRLGVAIRGCGGG